MVRLAWCAIVGLIVLMGVSMCAEANLLSGLFESDVPVYPALRKTEEQSLVLDDKDMTIMRFEGSDVSIPDVVDYYKKVLGQKGWTNAGERAVWNNAVVIQFSHKEKGSVLSFMFIPAEIFGKPARSVMVEALYIPRRGDSNKKTEALASGKDMPGEDISGVVRYPGSTRISSMQTGMGMMSATYKIMDSSCVECIADFYKQEMPKNGWTLVQAIGSTKDEMLARFSDENQNADSAEGSERMDQLLEQLQAIDPGLNKEALQGRMQRRFPDAMQLLFFQKGKLNCVLTITYSEPREGAEDQFSQLEKIAGDERFAPQDEKVKEMMEQSKKQADNPWMQEVDKMKALFRLNSNMGILVSVNVSAQKSDLRSTQW